MTTTTMSNITTTTIPFITVPTTTLPTGIIPTNTTNKSSSIFDVNMFQTPSQSQNLDYENLVKEIKNTIDKNNQLFQQIQKSNYPNAGSYQSDLINYKIDVKVNDLKNTRQEIWDFINKKYNENTKLKKFYFDEIRKADEFLKIQINDLQELQKQYTISESNDSSANEKIKQDKFIFLRTQYYNKLYITLFIIQIILLIILFLGYLEILPVITSLVICLIIVIFTLLYIGYFVLYKNLGRSKRSWDKKEHNNYELSTILAPINIMNVNNQMSDKSNIDDEINKLVNKQKETSVTCKV